MLHGRWPRLLVRSNSALYSPVNSGPQTGSQLIVNAALPTRSATTQSKGIGTSDATLSPIERYARKIKSRVGLDVKQLRTNSAPSDTADYYRNKYAEKLKEKAASLGISVEELESKARQQRLNREKEALKSAREQERIATLEPTAAVSIEQRQASVNRPQKREGSNGIKPLDSIVKLELLTDKEPEAIGKIWNQHHTSKPGRLSAVIPAETYRQLMSRAKAFPSFVLPLPRSEGVEFFWLQFSGHQCYFTSLAEYKLQGEQARPYLVITHYPDLIESKQIVLMRGELGDVDKQEGPSLITTEDARLLIYMLQDFYVTGPQDKQKLVEQFHRQPATFKFEELIDSVTQLG